MKKLIAFICLAMALVSLSAFAAKADTETSLWPAYDPETGLWGYINEQGAWGIEPQYTWASHFHGGCAIVDTGTAPLWQSDCTQGIIDTTGMFILEPRYLLFDMCDEGVDEVYFVMDNTVQDDEMMGWFNIPNRFFSGLHWYECLSSEDSPYVEIRVGNRDAEMGLADRAAGEIVVEPAYTVSGFYVSMVEDGFLAAERADTRECELIEIGVGAVELPEGVVIDYYPGVSEGLLPFEQDGLYGYINTAGEIVIPAQFDAAHDFRDGYAEVGLLDEVRTSAIIDRNGNVVISGLDVYYGMVADALFVEWPDGTWGLVETDGTIRCRHTLPEEAFEVFWLHEFTEDGPLWVEYSLGDDEYAWGLMSREGELLGEPRWQSVSRSGDLVAVCEDSAWGYVDVYGNTVLPFIYEDAGHFEGALARVRFDESTEGYIDRSGEVVYQWPMTRED